MNVMTIVWTYAAFILAGGLVGFLKAKSKASLVMSTACAIPLALVGLGHLHPGVALGVAAFLLLFFARRYLVTRKVMPAGLMAVVSLLVLAALAALTRR